MSLHADALATLTAWAPPTPEQAALRERYVAHLHERLDGMSRACRPDHLTASTLVLSADGSRALILDQVTNGVAVRMAVLYLCGGIATS